MNLHAVSTVRALSAADIPAVATLFCRIFLHRSGSVPVELERYLTSTFLTGPWVDPQINSLVHVRLDGTISGFIGALSLPLQWGERRLRGAICSTLMVDDHETDPMAGARLMRAFLAGPQDLSFCETASEVSIAMWQRLKGVSLLQHSLTYLRILRPFGYMAETLRQRTALAAPLALLAGPIDGLVRIRLPQGAQRRWAYKARPDDRLTEAPLTPDALIALLPRFLAECPIRPNWSPETIARILAEAAIKPKFGPLTLQLVQTAGGEPVGAFAYHGRPGNTAHVLQVFAPRRHAASVVDRMFSHAARSGMVAVVGRTEPHLLQALAGSETVLVQNATSAVHSRDPELVAAYQRGDGFLNGRAGESWSRLIGDDFKTSK